MAAALVVTVALGLASRAWTIGFVVWDEVLGDALYAVALYLVVALVSTALRRRWSVQVLAGIAVAVCWALEAFQSTGWTATTVSSPSLRTVLGTTFELTDLIWYLIGVVLIAVVDVFWLRPGVALPDLARSGSRSDW